MSVVRVQASAFDVESDVTIKLYTCIIFEIFEIIIKIVHSCNVNPLYIYRIFFNGSHYFFPYSCSTIWGLVIIKTPIPVSKHAVSISIS